MDFQVIKASLICVSSHSFLEIGSAVPIATTSNHEDDFGKVYANSSADIAT